MMTQPQLELTQTHLHDKLLARLAMRWPKAATYMPERTNRVLCARPLPDVDQAQLDTYTLAYQDAIEDILNMIAKGETRPEPPLALRTAENTVFQGGSAPRVFGSLPGGGRRGPAKDRGVRRDSDARRRLEDLFTGGKSDDV
jgi:hypothetical protein